MDLGCKTDAIRLDFDTIYVKVRTMNVLVVDLDESLVRTDLLYEQIFSFLKRNPLNVFIILKWIIMGGALGLKRNLAAVVYPKVEALPYRQGVLDLIKEKRRQNFVIVLASASPRVWVERVANHLGLFDHVIGSEELNLKGKIKHQEIVSRIGTDKFIYVGDSGSDMEIWDRCGGAVAVNVSPGHLKVLKERSLLISEISDRAPKSRLLVKQMRVHQWAKNALLFVPLLASHKIEFSAIAQTLLGFVSFGLAASAVYVLNDLIDIDSDRNHHSKRNRPLAAGALRIQDAISLFLLLVLAALFGGAFIHPEFIAVIVGYWLLNILYTFYFKKEVVLDIILLSGMYTMRLFAGAAVVQVPVSHWLLSFSTLFFFSLACVKRYTELSRSQNKPTIDGRGYRGLDQGTVQVLGIGTGVLSILVVLLYLQSPEVKSLYSNGSKLWLLTPILLYWLGRLWILTGRDEIHDDPVVFAIKDRVSWMCFAVIFLVMIVAV